MSIPPPRVGVTLNLKAFPAGTTDTQAVQQWNKTTGTTSQAAKIFYQDPSSWPTSATDSKMDPMVQACINLNMTAILCFKPNTDGSDSAALETTLKAHYDAGLGQGSVPNPVIVFHMEIEGNISTAQEAINCYVNYYDFTHGITYGTIADWEVWIDHLGYAGYTKWAAYSPGPPNTDASGKTLTKWYVDGQAVDMYVGNYFLQGSEHDPLRIANDISPSLPFGWFEMGITNSDTKTPSMNDIQCYFVGGTMDSGQKVPGAIAPLTQLARNGRLGPVCWWNGPGGSISTNVDCIVPPGVNNHYTLAQTEEIAEPPVVLSGANLHGLWPGLWQALQPATTTQQTVLAGHSSAAAGSTTLTFSPSQATVAGDTLAIWATGNGPAVTGVSDSVNGSWTLVPGSAVTSGTSPLTGSWWLFPGAAALDTTAVITVTYSSTAGAKTAELHDIQGYATILDAASVQTASGTFNGSTGAPSVTSGTRTVSGEIILAGLVSANSGGTPTWTPPATGVGADHNGTQQYSATATETASGTTGVTVAATVGGTSTTWGMSILAMRAAGGPLPSGTGFALVGATTAPASGSDWVAAATNYNTYTNTHGGLLVQKKFLSASQTLSGTAPTTANDIAGMAALKAQGCQFVICFEPPVSGWTSTTDTNFLKTIAAYVAAGFTFDVILANEPNGDQGNGSPKFTASGYQAYWTHYYNLIKNANATAYPGVASLHVCFNPVVTSLSQGIKDGTEFLPLTPDPDKVYIDWYAADVPNINPTAIIAAVNNMTSKPPIGIGGFGASAGGTAATHYGPVQIANGSNGGPLQTIASWGSAYGGNGVLLVDNVTSDFPTTGSIWVLADNLDMVEISYTGKTSTSFTGCAFVKRSPNSTADSGNTTSGKALAGNPAGGDWDVYWPWIDTVFSERPENGWVNAPIIYFDNGNDVNNFIPGPSDYKVAGVYSIDQNCNVNNIKSSLISITGVPDQSTPTGQTASYQIEATDTGPGAILSFTDVVNGSHTLPPGLSINSATGLIGPGTVTTPGNYQVTITVSDQFGASDTVTFDWSVATSQVTITNPGSLSGTVGQSPAGGVIATDTVSTAILTYGASGLPQGISIDPATGHWLGTFQVADTYQVTLTCSDNLGSTAPPQTFTWQISPPQGILGLSLSWEPGTDSTGNSYPAGLQAGEAGSGQLLLDLAGNLQFAGPSGSKVFRINPTLQRILVYSDPAGPGNLLLSIALAAGVDNFGNSYPAGLRWHSPWHTMPTPQNKWAVGGSARYRYDDKGDLQVAFADLTVGTATDGTLVWAAGSLPAGYQPAAAVRAGMLEFETDGSVKCYSVGSATRVDLYGTIPLT